MLDGHPRPAERIPDPTGTSYDSQVDMLAGQRRALRFPTFAGTYGMEAAINLTTFRSNLLEANLPLFLDDGPTTDWHRRYARFDMYQPTVRCPPRRPLRRIGPGVGEDKRLCDVSALTAPCIVYSLGSNMEFDFEYHTM